MNTDGTNKKQLTFDKNDDISPAVSSDGQKIAFVSTRTGRSEIYIMDIDGNNKYQLTSFGANHPEWSSNDEWIYISKYSIIDSYRCDIFKIRPDGSNLKFVANEDTRDISIEASPDGKYIYFSADPNWTPDSKIIRVDANGSNPIIVEDADSHHETDFPVSPDGNMLLVSEGFSYFGNPGNIYTIDLISMKTNQIFLPNGKESYIHGSWSPDGTKIIYCYTNNYDISEFDIYIADNDGNNIRQITNTPDIKETQPIWVFSPYH
jgi:TolB protein